MNAQRYSIAKLGSVGEEVSLEPVRILNASGVNVTPKPLFNLAMYMSSQAGGGATAAPRATHGVGSGSSPSSVHSVKTFCYISLKVGEGSGSIHTSSKF